MSNIVPRGVRSRTPAAPDGFTWAEGKALQAATNREVANGIISNTRLSVANFVTHTGMQHTAGLIRQAYSLADGDEYIASRLGTLIDGYVAVARDEINSLRRMA